mgnify:CR=1 FL=1
MSIGDDGLGYAAKPGVYVPLVVTPQAITRLRAGGMARLARRSRSSRTSVGDSSSSAIIVGGSVIVGIAALAYMWRKRRK